MVKKYPKSAHNEAIKNSSNGQQEAYVSWAGDSEAMSKAMTVYGNALSDGPENVVRASRYSYDYSNLTESTSGRPGLSPLDFDWFRPGQQAPTKPKDIIAYARYVYRRIGLIHNAMDLMGDFACQGIRLVHPNKTIENFYTNWFSQVNGKQVSERLAHLLFREANVPIRSYTAKINKKKRQQMQKSVAVEDIRFDMSDKKSYKNELPWRYSFIDPILIEHVGGVVGGLSNKQLLLLKIPARLRNDINKMLVSQDPNVQSMIKEISPDILRAVREGKDLILPPDKTYLYHYKKDDWQQWADPITYSAFEPLNLYQRLQLADKAALDGAISKIRVWKLGSLEHKLAPTPVASSTLSDMLGANVGGGTIDIVWGPDIELVETKTDVQAFLGEEKYKPTLMAIYATLGIPPTLTGTLGGSGGTTNNFISLKTLTERLNYVRDIVVKFWDEQVKDVQKAMGFKLPAQVEFDHMYLEDPAAVATLLLNMSDRNIVSEEFVQNYIKAKPKVEKKRLEREKKIREKSESEKISPYHAVDKDHDLRKIALQTGITTPSEVGLTLDEKKANEKSALDFKEAAIKNKSGRPGETNKTGQPGRPKNTKDATKRKEKTFKPKLKASAELWAKSAQVQIAELVHPLLLNSFNKTSMRNLNSTESKEVEDIKFEILCNMSIGEDVTKDTVAKAYSSEKDNSIHEEFEGWLSEAIQDNGKLSIDQIRDLRASYCTYYKLEKTDR